MTDKIRILVADDIQDTRALIIRLLGMSERFEVVGEAANGKAVLDFFELQDADMVLIDINMPIMNGLEATRALMQIKPDVIVVIMSVQSESEYLKKAMLCGAKEYIIKPFNFEMLTQTLEATYNEYQPRIAAQREAFAQHQPTPQRHARIHAFFGGKGHVGKTFIASQMAWLMSSGEGKRVLLIDGDLQFGDVGLAMGLKPYPQIVDLAEDKHGLNYELIQTYLQQPFDNCHVLLAPPKPDAAEGLSKSFIEAILEAVEGQYDVILIDLGVNYNELTLTFLDWAHQVHLVATPTVSALHHTKTALDVMRSLSYDKTKVHVILNGNHKHSGFTIKEVEGVLGAEVKQVLEQDSGLVTDALNRGDVKTMHKGFNKPKLSKELQALAKALLQ